MGAREPGRYGLMWVGDKARARGVHRVCWQIHNGAIPEGLFVCHRCDNPICVNPAHLFLGSASDNMRDMSAKGRGKANRQNGEANHAAKLREADVIAIRQMAARGDRIVDIADRYGVSRRAIGMVVSGRNWAHVPMEVAA